MSEEKRTGNAGATCNYSVFPGEDGKLIKAGNEIPARSYVSGHKDCPSEDRKGVHGLCRLSRRRLIASLHLGRGKGKCRRGNDCVVLGRFISFRSRNRAAEKVQRYSADSLASIKMSILRCFLLRREIHFYEGGYARASMLRYVVLFLVQGSSLIARLFEATWTGAQQSQIQGADAGGN